MHCIPVKNIFFGDDASKALISTLHDHILSRDENVAIVYCTVGMEQTIFQARLGLGPLPKDVYAVVHPDNVYNVMENIRSRARTVQPTESLLPTPKIKLFLDTPALVEFKAQMGHHWLSYHIDHRHIYDAVMLADEVHTTSQMVPVTASA